MPRLNPRPDSPDALAKRATDPVGFKLKLEQVEQIKPTARLAEADQLSAMTPREQISQMQNFFAD